MSAMRFVSATLAILGAAVVALASTIPYATVCDVNCVTNQRPSLLDDANHRVSWLAVGPGLVVALAVLGVLLILAGRRPAWMLVATGVVTAAFFAGLLAMTGTLPGGGIGALIGAAGGFVVALAGGAAFTFPSPNPDNRMTGP